MSAEIVENLRTVNDPPRAPLGKPTALLKPTPHPSWWGVGSPLLKNLAPLSVFGHDFRLFCLPPTILGTPLCSLLADAR